MLQLNTFVLLICNILIFESWAVEEFTSKRHDDTLEPVRKESTKAKHRYRRSSDQDLFLPFLQKTQALEFLQPHHRTKRGLSEECREGCSYEEVEEVLETTSRVKAYMFEYNCERQSCPAGCFDNNADYSHSDNLDIQCNPHCDGKGNPAACDIHYTDDVQITRVGEFRDGIGYCGSIDTCSQCNDGFYGGDKYCYICGKIDHCLHRKCADNNQNLICAWCDGEKVPRQYWRAYTGDSDNRQSCQKTCNWRAESTRCYPGTCASELAANCQCATNFDGPHCEKITDAPPILENHGIFYDDIQRKIQKIENDPNHVTDGHPIVWSNFVNFGVAKTRMSAKYLQPNVGLDADHYVRNFKVGLIEMKTTISLYRGGSLKSSKVQTCGTMNKYEPVDHLTCDQEFYLSTYTGPNWLPLQHDDKIIYQVSATNGGFVTVQNRDLFPREVVNTHFYEGQTTTREFEYHWDLETPYHCSKTQGASCTPFIFIQQDITDNPNIVFTWGGWTDDMSGMSHFTYELFDLVATADGLKDGFDIKETNTLPNATSFSITVLEPSVYTIHIAAFDVAGNHKAGRGIFFFDDQSVVTIHSDPMKCTTASKDTNYVWVIEDVSTVEVIWPERFQNVRHKNNRWLNPVMNLAAGTDPIYEDLYGNRTNVAIPHIHGIVEFQVAFDVMDPSPKDTQPFTALPSNKLTDQSTSVTVNWADGDRLNLTVQAYDILKTYAEETVNIYRDASPPIIENLWLTRGDRLNVSVHRIEDFNEMTIEWMAYDYHSGLEEVYWKLYDNYQTYVEHGYEDIVAQGHAADLPECETKYGSSPRGANCYCTPFMGCFHQHFQVKPQIKAHGGLVLGKDRGVHDSDYYIEIAVKNKALVQTILTKKITVDISPPHAGIVHDGLPGNPEIDYQQGLDLNAYWDQFFDRESGVFFYQYIMNTTCADKSMFGLNLPNDTQVVETYNTFGAATAPGDGTYYFTVVAYNRALDPSEPVCSDGVTIDSTVPGVKEVIISGAIITGGLVTDVNQTDFYILDSDRYRRLIRDSTFDCLTKATPLANIDLFPIKTFENGTTVTVDGADFCSNSTGSSTSIGLILSKASLLEISWTPLDIPGKVYDYEVGISSTDGSAAPDLMAFESTKQHDHHRIMHTNIPDATEFYIIIKTISKSNVEGLTSVGPCFIDTTPPDFTGTISVSLDSGFLVATWAANSFVDSEELFDMEYEFAVGHSEYGTDVQNFRPIQSGASCTVTSPPLCTAANVSTLDWYLHGHHTYYMTIKVKNTAGLVKLQTSAAYIHDVQRPAEGVVIDTDTQDMEDQDFQTETTSMSARWSGFAHPHLDVTYKISIGTTPGGSDVVSPTDVGAVTMHQETGLTLTPYQKYYFTVTADSVAGTTTVSSDGVTIVTESDTLSGVMIYDGIPCNMTMLTATHHEEDNRMDCSQEVDVQMSLNSLKAYWTVPNDMKRYTTDAFVAVEKRSGVGNVWSTYQDYIHISTMYDVSFDDLTLSPGIKYRLKLKLCAKVICFSPISTDGVMVIANPPVSGDITVTHLNTTETGGAEKLVVSFTKFYDPDIEDVTEKNDAILKYEWAITDNSVVGQTYTQWTNLDTFTTSGNQINFELTLTGEMDFSRCKRFSVRGLNLVKLSSEVSTEIEDCDAFNPILINPNIVIDAVGKATDQDGVGLPVYLEENARWPEPDKDYTPYKSLISAVWPSLRHGKYKYAIIDAKNVDVTTYYKQVNQLNLRDPCIPDAIRCGSTNREFMNEEFTNNELVHGTRYTVCVHADRTLIQMEKWLQDLPEINACSDGIIVDLTPPKEGRLWIGHNPGTFYQTSNTDMYVNWDNFIDVEEFNNGPHPSGIMQYILGIGTSSGGNDVVAFENVGVIQHKSLHQLNLQNGYKYYATLKAIDFGGRETEVVSEPVIIDYTPPATTNEPIVLPDRHITSTTEIDPCWKGVFVDLESGIDYYLWSIGSEPGYVDVLPYMRVEEDECGQTDRNNPLDLKNGHYYYVNVRAYNNAGLSSLATSWAFRVETTPPTAGHVYDGEKSQMTGNVKDIDFQTETKVLHSYWEGFHDSHSNIKEYYVAVGTCPGCGDVLAEQAVGITEEFTLENIHLGTGLTYYTTVTACNTADMCTTVTSDGVIIDNSAPVAGSVQDGTGFYDTEYQSITSYISAKWYGFDDPQSGLSHYVWMVGTSIGASDLVPETELHLTETASFYNTSLSLPQGRRIFVTVRAYNKAGLHSESTSNGFLIDTSPPVISKAPTFSTDFGINGLKQIYRTAMKVEWAAEDADSYIKRQYLSIKSHIGGEFMLSSQQVNGIARSFVFNGLDLHDGVTYYVTLISCNSADICVMSTSSGMFVDSSPPSRGMFAIKTDHAADPELLRHASGWMVWSRQAVHLAWLGFSDLHSGIDYYKVAVGSTYLNNDLNQDPNEVYKHTVVNTDHGDEGKVQLFTVKTETLTAYDTLYISVWAVNTVGVRSSLIHSAFRKVPGGPLELIRRCDPMSCDGHCVCAPQDQKCPINPNLGACTDVSANNNNNLLLVRDTNGFTNSKDQAVTATDNVLRGYWIVSQVQGLKPLWYEWSVGYNSLGYPAGIYNSVEEKVWQDAGRLVDCTFTAKPGVHLENTISYAVFVRIWYSPTQYAVFKSNGIVVMGQAPVLAKVRGRAVTEIVRGTTVKDIDYMQIGRPITYSWHGKFLQADETIEKYSIYLSTSPGGYDILPVTQDLGGSVTSYNMSGIKLTPGVIHYSNVIAYNYAGAHTTATSDGFVIDATYPNPGIVYDGLGTNDLEFTNTSDSVGAHWHGFTDTESGIEMYFWCVGTTTFINNRNPEKSDCSILPWRNVGLHVSASSNVSSDIPQGTKIYHKVYAIDNAGKKSVIVVSDGVIVDQTPPMSEKFEHAENNLVSNGSFEVTGGNKIHWNNISSFDVCSVTNSYHPLSWIPDALTCMAVVTSDVNLARDGQSFLFIRGSVTQQLHGVKAGQLYRVTFYTSHLPITNAVAANKEGFVQMGDGEKTVFLIYTKSYRFDGHGVQAGREELSWHAHTFYIRPDEDNVNITIGSSGSTTGLLLDNLSVQEVSFHRTVATGHVQGHVVYVHEWSSIHGSWSFTDPDSSIIDYSWAIGYSSGGTQIQPFRSVGLANYAFNSNVTLVHNTFIYVTAIATNAAGLRGVSYSDPVLVDLTPPDIKFINDGRGEDEDAWIFNEVVANWAVEDLESGIKFCKMAIGYTPGTTELLPYTEVTANSAYRDFDYSILEGFTVYTTLSCENNGGLSFSKSTDGVKISSRPPATANVQLEVLSLSSTEYNTMGAYQGVTDNLRVKWSGFTDHIGIETYQVKFPTDRSETMFFPANQEVLYTHFTKMSLGNTIHDISVRAMNKLFLKSTNVDTNVTVTTETPTVDGSKDLTISYTSDQVFVSWDSIFASSFPLYYEVSAGTYSSGVNIVQWQFTNQTSITFGIPTSTKAESGMDIHVTVKGVTVGGFSGVKTGKFKLP